ncbi:MAG: condensation domain-containing protein [Candidatus Aminicenantes bacterium]|jgi:acyl carrier protein
MRDHNKDNCHTIDRSQRLIFANQNTKEKEFWLKKLAGKPIINAFPFDRPKAVRPGAADSQEFRWEQPIFSRLVSRADSSDYKLHIILMAGVMLLLNRYTASHDVMIVTPIYQPETDREFINTLLPINVRIKDSMTFLRLLKETAAALKEAAAHRNYPVDLIPEKLNLAPVGGYSLFDVALVLKNIHHQHHLHPITPRISFSFQRCDNVIIGRLEYDTLLYEQSFIRQVIGNLMDLLEWVLQRPEEPVSRMKVTVEVQQRQLKTTGQVTPTAGREGDPVYCPPRDKIEKKLVEIWSESLEINRSHVGIDDVFFELDGQSLKAIMISASIHKTFNISIPLPLIFQLLTIRGLADHIKKAIMEGTGNIARYASIRPVEKKEYYFLSPAQKRLYILKQLNPDSRAYNMTLVCLVETNPDKKKLEKVFLQLIKRHEGLRTSFSQAGGQVVQKVHAHVDFSVEYFQGGPDQDKETIIRNFVRPFDLSRAPLLRVGLICIKKDHWMLMVDMHHIISDASSHGILSREFAALYAGEKLPALRLHYRDYSQWWELPEQQQEVKKQENYWLRQFEDEAPLLDLPTDFVRPATRSFEGSAVEFAIDGHQYTALQELTRISGSTLFIVLMAIFNVFLSRLNGQEDIVVGTPIVGRSHSDLQGIIGMFVNTLALRNYPEGHKKFIDFLMELKEKTLQAFENQDYPFEDLVQHVDTRRDMARNPLFTAMLSLHNLEEGVETPGLKMELYDYETRSTKFDLLLRVLETEEKLVCSFRYCTKLFKKETIRRFINYFNKIMSIVMENHDIQLKDVTIPNEFLEVDTQVNRDEFSDFGF